MFWLETANKARTRQSRYYDTDGKLMNVTVMTLQSDRDRVQSRYYDTDGKLVARTSLCIMFTFTFM
jgi:hypothetical protein